MDGICVFRVFIFWTLIQLQMTQARSVNGLVHTTFRRAFINEKLDHVKNIVDAIQESLEPISVLLDKNFDNVSESIEGISKKLAHRAMYLANSTDALTAELFSQFNNSLETVQFAGSCMKNELSIFITKLQNAANTLKACTLTGVGGLNGILNWIKGEINQLRTLQKLSVGLVPKCERSQEDSWDLFQCIAKQVPLIIAEGYDLTSESSQQITNFRRQGGALQETVRDCLKDVTNLKEHVHELITGIKDCQQSFHNEIL